MELSQLKLTVSEQTPVPEWANQLSPPWGFPVEAETAFQWNEINTITLSSGSDFFN